MNKSKSADGVSGHLLHIGSTWVFRVYDQNNNFVDYDIQHSDLCVTINDADAFFYRDEYADTLDHSPETLGKQV